VNDGFKFTHVAPVTLVNKKVRSKDEVIITTSSEAPALANIEDTVLVLSFDDDLYPLSEPNIANFYRMFRILMDTGIKECKSIAIGIDPGFKHTGLSLFINGTFVEATIIPTSDAKIKEFISMALSTALQNNLSSAILPLAKIRVGNGNLVEMQKVLDIISTMGIDDAIEIKIVDEANSNTDYVIQKSSFIKIGDHARAAINIALRDGETLDKLKEHGYLEKTTEFSKKQLRNVQAESRAISGESGITIDQKLATEVLLGTISLQDAISLYKDGRNKVTRSARTPDTS
jgi:hypothetical protein